MFRKKESRQDTADRPIIKVYGAGIVRVDSESLIRTPKAQEQLETIRRLQDLGQLGELTSSGNLSRLEDLCRSENLESEGE